MKNKIVQLRDGTTTCRILDTIIKDGNTLYLVIDFESKYLSTIKPIDIFDIVEPNKEGGFHSIRDIIIQNGL